MIAIIINQSSSCKIIISWSTTLLLELLLRIVVKLLITLKHGGSFNLECPATILGPSGAGVSYDPEFITTFFIGDLDSYDTTDTFAQVQASADGPCTVEDFDILTIKV